MCSFRLCELKGHTQTSCAPLGSAWPDVFEILSYSKVTEPDYVPYPMLDELWTSGCAKNWIE
jgi:hypothetical protein